MNNFKIEGYIKRIICDTINRMQLGETISDKKKNGRLTSWKPARKNQLKRLTNVAWFWTMKNILLMMAQRFKETTITTRMTNLNDQIVFALLEKTKLPIFLNNSPS